ncbi:transcription factor Opi1-domain-containing protein [Aspergillus coremiiformis]|uniref:Transcription factor Opi1-domain-containing protein n=1 Tax=Aspergillus coremiiformis TaxID=138285 RepID=A0A5N6Z9P9_9EURO|nr:transcription factor Opi1-domain-containing protein [Aspergillus coremiiformis]
MDNRSGGLSSPDHLSVSFRNATTTSSKPHTITTSTVSALPAPKSGYLSFKNVPTTMMDLDHNTVTEDRFRRATSVLSMDDIEAAQALEGLRTEYGQPPRNLSRQTSSPESTSQPEPLLSLLTSTHPLISSAINGSVSAYTSSKSYSPRFKSGAEFIERNIGSPVANTVGTVGRKTGVESGLRWALQRRGSGSTDPKRSKRRKVNGDKYSAEMDLEKGETRSAHRVRSSSDLSMAESLPPYDDQTSPSYEEVDQEGASRQNPTWHSRLMISTSGLGVAMSEESLRSLQYCLTWLKWANGRLGKAIVALQRALREWDTVNPNNDASQDTLISQRIQAVKEDVLSTLKQVVDVVSKYAGGALPENARNLVRRHLTSLPHRFQVASTSHPPPDSTAASSDATISAHRILVLAQEGLDMMAQVSGVVNDTLVSAELWCERLGKKRPDSKDRNEVQQPESRNVSFPEDVKQPIREPSHDVPMTGTEEQV